MAEELPFEQDGGNVRVTAPTGEVLLVVGWTEDGALGTVTLDDGSATFAADRRLTAYRLVPVGRWEGGPQGIRCNPVFEDCPIPPDPDPGPGPGPGPIPIQQLDVSFVRGRP
jgi:hypothetical protein